MFYSEKFYKIRNVRGYPILQIPKSVLAIAGFRVGDHIFYTVEKGKICIRRVDWHYDGSERDRDKQD